MRNAICEVGNITQYTVTENSHWNANIDGEYLVVADGICVVQDGFLRKSEALRWLSKNKNYLPKRWFGRKNSFKIKGE